MALIKCQECGTEISDKALACVRCGAPVVKQKPQTEKTALWAKALIFLIFAGVVFLAIEKNQEDAMHKKEAEAQKDVLDAQAARVAEVKAEAGKVACKNDLQCWGEKGIGTASVYCKDQIEKLAAHSMRWTDRFLEPKFSHFRWLDKDQSTVTFIGDRAEFQNGFGAYTAVTYECDLDQESKQVFDVRVAPGRL